MDFVLMHGDVPVLVLSYDRQLHAFTSVRSLENPAHVPVAAFGPDGQIYLRNLNAWWSNRAIPRTRDGYKRLAEALHLANPAELLEESHALSLSDTYWIRGVDEDLTWGDVNYFDNDFDDELGLFTLGESSSRRKGLPKGSPSSSVSGDLMKAWVTADGGKRVLLKAGRGIAAQEVYNEAAASALYARIMEQEDFVPYHVVRRGSSVYSACPNMLNGESDLVTAADLLFRRKHRGNASDYEWCVSGLEASGAPDVEYKLCRMLACDFVLGNFDRHYNNFGLIRDATTLEFTGLAPIYDSGNSLWCDKPLLDAPIDYAYEPLPFGYRKNPLDKSNPEAQLDMLGDWRWYRENMFADAPDVVREVLSSDENIAPARLDKVVDAVARNVQALDSHAHRAAPYEGTCSERMRAAGKRVDSLPCRALQA